MDDLGWSKYIEVQEKAAEWEWLCKMYDEMTELAEYPPFSADAVALRNKLAGAIAHEHVQSSMLTGEAVISVLIKVGERGPFPTVTGLLEALDEEIQKVEGANGN